MRFVRADVAADLEAMRRSRSTPLRALGDNFLFEERVSDGRRELLEKPPNHSVLELQAEHYRSQVQGFLRSHSPVTFGATNDLALYGPDIEPNQKVIRLECVDDALSKLGRTFEDLKQALKDHDAAFIEHVVDQCKLYPGARPAFVAFKSEVSDLLAKNDWLVKLRDRLGLGHYSPAPGQRQSFALMEYLVKDVLAEWHSIRGRGALRPFAFPTVLESRASPYFFPSPSNLTSSFVVDLGSQTTPVREMLHVRIDYRLPHLVRVGELVGPLPPIKLSEARDAHLAQLRKAGARKDFGELIAGSVDD